MARRRQPFTSIMRVLRARHPDRDDLEQLLADRRVTVDGHLVDNPRALVRRDARVRLLPERRLRGDVKLASAIEALELDVSGAVAVDVGAAAGGFTTALLRGGARRVYAVDTGYGQLVGSLRADERVVNLERTNVAALGPALVPEVVDIVTLDLSYTSIAEGVLPLDRLHLADGARLVALVKPTFELAAATVVVDHARVTAAIGAAVDRVERAGWTCTATTLPGVSGRRGAVEAFLLATRARR